MNKHRGSSFDDFLREEGIFEEVRSATIKRFVDPKYVTIQLDTLMKAAHALGQNVKILFEPLPRSARGKA